MDKLKMTSMDKVQSNVEKIKALFPNAVTEVVRNGKVELKVDFEVLKQELANELIDDKEQRYQFTWPDKQKSILLANTPINKTLRPCKEESVDFDNTQNLYIEGDNLEVLKLLQETYLGKIKMIYIDPPYNTGNDFVYNDDFAQSSDEYMENSGQYDDYGNRLAQNTESNGRFHTDWLNMIYPRLRLAKDLLTDDGIIFISIDDNEQENLKKICDEILGESNFLAQVIWERAYSPVNLKKHFSECHDYILCYAKNIENLVCNGLPRSGEANERYSNPDNDPRGVWKSSDMSVGPRVEKNVYEIIAPSGRSIYPPSGRCWRVSEEKFKELLADNRIWFGTDGNNVPATKRFLSEVKDGMTPMTIWKYTEVGHSQDAAKKLMAIFDGKAFFDYPKSVDLIKRCVQLYSTKECVVLDFFSGSATTAHAVMQLNAEDGGNRKFIMVQLPELCDEKSEAYKAGYKNICEIGKERIRRAGKKIKEENGEKAQYLDIGFRVLKLDSSNMKDVYYKPEEYDQIMIGDMQDNIKSDRTELDLLFQVMLELGKPLSAKITQKVIAGKSVVNVDDGDLIACFEDNITAEIVTEIAKVKPLYAVFRDSGLSSDSVAANFEQIFATYSPSTKRKVL
ncbi:MAG: site-specific DNA-methyltransferase [Clostridia bacterium]|nr:site-specific DNA-methyltransferase [Clostridia bacterium]